MPYKRERARECKEEKNNQERRSSFTAECHGQEAVGDRYCGLGQLSGNSLLRPGSVSLSHPVASRPWEHKQKQTEFLSVLSKNRKSQVASLCSQLGSPALGVQDLQRAWKAGSMCPGVRGLEPFLMNFLVQGSP